jgi:hypothetical protein
LNSFLRHGWIQGVIQISEKILGEGSPCFLEKIMSVQILGFIAFLFYHSLEYLARVPISYTPSTPLSLTPFLKMKKTKILSHDVMYFKNLFIKI